MVHLPRQRRKRDGKHRTRRTRDAVPRDPRVPQPPKYATAACPDHQEIIIPAGDLGKHEPGFAAHHQWFNVHARGHAAERVIEGAPQPLPRGIPPCVPQFGDWAAALSEVPAWRDPGVHGEENRVARPRFSRSPAQRLQAAH
jgi:hypothetical protein